MIDASCDSCEASFKIEVVEEGIQELQDAESSQGIYCPLCSSYIEFNEDD